MLTKTNILQHLITQFHALCTLFCLQNVLKWSFSSYPRSLGFLDNIYNGSMTFNLTSHRKGWLVSWGTYWTCQVLTMEETWHMQILYGIQNVIMCMNVYLLSPFGGLDCGPGLRETCSHLSTSS